jgi:hypothetical protein
MQAKQGTYITIENDLPSNCGTRNIGLRKISMYTISNILLGIEYRNVLQNIKTWYEEYIDLDAIARVE